MFFDRLRKKPKNVRDQYAFFGAAMITGVIALVWIVSVQVSLRGQSKASDAIVDNETVGAFSQFFQASKENMSNIFNSLGTDETATTTETTAEEEPVTFDSSIEATIQATMDDVSGAQLPPQAPQREIQIDTTFGE